MRLPITVFLLAMFVGLATGQSNLLLDTEPAIPTGGSLSSKEDRLQSAPPAQAWTAFGATEVSLFKGQPTFIVRNGGHFFQDVAVAPALSGKYALLVGIGSSSRVFTDVDITDHPYLYGYMMEDDRHILAYLQGQRMLWESQSTDELKCLYGVFPIPAGTSRIRFYLNQAQRNGTEHDGSAARFSRPGLYIFDDETAAKEFAPKHCGLER